MRRTLARIRARVSGHGGSALQVVGSGAVVAGIYLAAGLSWGLISGGIAVVALSLALE